MKLSGNQVYARVYHATTMPIADLIHTELAALGLFYKTLWDNNPKFQLCSKPSFATVGILSQGKALTKRCTSIFHRVPTHQGGLASWTSLAIHFYWINFFWEPLLQVNGCARRSASCWWFQSSFTKATRLTGLLIQVDAYPECATSAGRLWPIKVCFNKSNLAR